MALLNRLSRNTIKREAQLLKRLQRRNRRDVAMKTSVGQSTPGVGPGGIVAQRHDELEDIVLDAAAVSDHDPRYLNLSGNFGDQHFIQFELTPTVTPAEGMIYWNDDDKTLDIKTETTTVIQVGQEMVVRGTNKTGVTLTNGQVVYVNGAQGNRPTFALAKADAEATSSGTLGIVTSDILDDANGYVTTFGLVRDIDTSGFSTGDMVYLSSTVAGGIVNVKPVSPAHLVTLGVVTTSDASVGVIFTRIINGFEVDELHDVLIASLANGNLLIYDSVAGLWKNGTTIQQLSSTGNALKIIRDLASGDTDSPVVEIIQDNAGDNQNSLTVRNDGAGDGISSISVFGDGITATTGSAANTVYGGKFDHIRASSYCDFEEGAAPVAAEANDVRLHAGTDSVPYVIDDAGVIRNLVGLRPPLSKSANYTVVIADHGKPILCDASGGAFTLTLPAASALTGMVVTAKIIDSSGNGISVDPVGTDEIDQNGAGTPVSISAQNAVITIVSDGTDWWVV